MPTQRDASNKRAKAFPARHSIPLESYSGTIMSGPDLMANLFVAMLGSVLVLCGLAAVAALLIFRLTTRFVGIDNPD